MKKTLFGMAVWGCLALAGGAAMGEALVIHGGLQDTGVVRSFQAEHPDIAVDMREEFLAAADIATWMRTGGADADIYILQVDRSGLNLLQNGFYTDLSASETLVEAVSKMYPPIQEAVRQGEALAAFPLLLQPLLWNVRADLLAAYGLAVPESFPAFVEMYAAWGEGPDGVQFCRDYGVRVDLLMQALLLYESTYQAPGQPLSFDNDGLREVLEAICAMPPAEYEDDFHVGREIVYQADSAYLFELFDASPLAAQPSFAGEGEYRVLLPPPFAPGEDQVMRADLYVLVVNPYAAHPGAAVAFLEHCAARLRPTFRYLCRADLTEPVVHADYAASAKQARAALQEAAGRLATAEAADRQAIGEDIARLERDFAYWEGIQWIIAPGAAERYREMAGAMRLTTESQLADAYAELRVVLIRMLAGQCTVAQGISEMDQVMRMVYYERAF